MPSSAVRGLVAASLVLSPLALAVPALGAATTHSATHVVADVLPGLASMPDRGALGPNARLRVGVVLANPREARIDAAQRAMYTPGSPTFHQFLTPREYDAHYGVPRSETDRVVAGLTQHGLRLAYTSGDGGYLVVVGRAAAVARTFHVTLRRFARPDGSTFYANVNNPTVPRAVSGVVGLSDFATLQPLGNPTGPDRDPATDKQKQARGCGLPVPGRCYGTLLPQDLWGVYNAPKSNFGNGIKVGVYGEENPKPLPSDLRHYESDHGLPQVAVRDILTNAATSDTSDPTEGDLDLDAVQGMAPDLAEVDVYFDSGDPADIATTFHKWAGGSSAPPILNISYGLCEPIMLALGWQPAMEPPLRQATMEGRTAFASSGDTGGSCAAGNGVVNDGVPAANYPASSAYVVGVGGTVLMTKNAGGTSQDEVWPPVRDTEIAWTHGGGGHSIMEPEPAYQQAIAPVTGRCVLTHDGSGVDTGVSPCRNVPDVAAISGDLLSGYAIYSGGGETSEGGTSLSSPVWAGFWARILAAHKNRTCAAFGARKAGPIGFADPTLYALGANGSADAKAFTDITTGSNGQNPALPRSAADPSGYDDVTGLGVPDVTGLMKLLDCGRLTPVASS
jgi:pseudomonalisin